MDVDELKGRCVSCGFLTKCTTKMYRYPKHYELSEVERERGQVEHPRDFQAGASGVSFGAMPIEIACYRGVTSFKFEDHPDSPPHPATLPDAVRLQVLDEGRQCPHWFPYRPNIGPERHWEELKMLELEQRERHFQEWMERDRQRTVEV